MIELKSILEALLFSAQKPLSPTELKSVFATAAEQSEDESIRNFKKIKTPALEAALAELAAEHEQAARTYRLVNVAGSWQFVTEPDFAPWLRVLAGEKVRPSRLSQPGLETLTIIAYRQPITRAEIEQIRGVSVDGVMQTLLDRRLVEQTGRAEVVGRPMQYGTTPAFLEYFGLASLDDLPGGDELRRIPVERPPSLVTVDAGLATAPPAELVPSPAPSPTPESADAEPAAPVTEPSGETTPPPVVEPSAAVPDDHSRT